MLLFACTPETVIGKPYLGPVPLYFVVFYFGLLASGVEILTSKQRLPFLMKGMVGVSILLLVHGILRGHGLKWMTIDFSSLMGGIAGYYWASQRPIHRILKLWHRLAGLITVLMALTLLGLAYGYVQPAIESGRIYVYSLFRSVGFLSIVMPLLWAAKSDFPIPRAPYWVFALPFLTVLCLIALTAYYTATRSMLLEGLCASFFMARITLSKTRGLGVIFFSFLLLLGVTVWDLELLSSMDLGALGDRIRNTGTQEESRFQEILMLFEQMSAYDYLFGMGLGSRFHSIVFVDGTDLALNPHLVIFAYLQKGGIFFFLAAVLIPTLVFGLRLLKPYSSPIQLGWLSASLMYLIMASLSGGWEFYFTFLYGCSLAMNTTSTRGP